MKSFAQVLLVIAGSGFAYPQGRGGADWTTAGNDAQRSSWVRSDAKISRESMQKPGFEFIWKLKLNNTARQSNAITAPALLDRYIGYRGFRSLGFVGGSSNAVFSMDTDLGRLEWERRFPPGSSAAATSECPGGMTANITRPTSVEIAAAPAGRGGGFGGRGGPARSGVGEPLQGAVQLSQPSAPRGGGGFPGAPGGPGRGAPGAPGRGLPGGGGGFGRTPSLAYALAGDGMLYSFYVSNGDDAAPPVRFLPANANAQGLIVVDNVAYVATSGGCGGAADGVWALDLASREVTSWKSSSGRIAGSGGAAMGPDGTVFITTAGGELAALEPKTLRAKATHKAGQGFASSPVLFQYKERTLIAAATTDGRIHLLDSATLAPLSQSAATADFSPGALASWEDGGVRWLSAPGASSVVAWKVADRGGSPALEPGWTSRSMTAPLTPMIVNGVMFTVSSGENRDPKAAPAERAKRSTSAVLYALDATTGKEYWNSGATMTSVARGGLSAGGSQIYVTTHDSTLYVFGMPIEH